VALAVKESGVDPGDDAGLEALLPTLTLNFEYDGPDLVLFLNGRNVSGTIRQPEISMLASAVSSRQTVRKYLLGLQQRMGQKKNMVFEGRDMGTVVFPDADIKIYLDAHPGERAKRRYEQLGGDTSPQSLNRVARDMADRDNNDRTRDLAPLIPAPDAHIIDSSEMDIDQVVESILSLITDKFGQTEQTAVE
jgi:cytidylate kinase